MQGQGHLGSVAGCGRPWDSPSPWSQKAGSSTAASAQPWTDSSRPVPLQSCCGTGTYREEAWGRSAHGRTPASSVSTRMGAREGLLSSAPCGTGGWRPSTPNNCLVLCLAQCFSYLVLCLAQEGVVRHSGWLVHIHICDSRALCAPGRAVACSRSPSPA